MYLQTNINNTGESVVVSYVLVLAIVAVLSTLLISSAGGYLSQQQQTTTETETALIAETLTSEIQEIDTQVKTFKQTSSNNTIQKTIQAADKISDEFYQISLTPTNQSNRYLLTITTSENNQQITQTKSITLYQITDVNTTPTISSQNMELTYTSQDGLYLSSTQDTTYDKTIRKTYEIEPNTAYYDSIDISGSENSVTGGENTIHYGSIRSDEQISLANNFTLQGSIISEESITIQDNATVSQNLSSNGTITIGPNSTIGGDITSTQTVNLQANTVVTGNVTGDLFCQNNVTIHQKSCTTYMNTEQ